MKQIHSNTESHKNRRGIAILWLIIWGSMFLTFFCGVLEIATMWQAHVEVKNSFDSAALAAAQEWGDQGVSQTNIPRNVGVAYTVANPILGVAYTPTTNLGTVTPANPNANATDTGNFVFGAIDTTTDPITFNGNAEASCAAGDVTITITQPNNGASANPSTIRLSFDAGTDLAIDSVAFTLPTAAVNNNQQPFFDAGTAPQVDTTGGSFNGVDVDASGAGPVWNCPNGNGDICFTFENQVAALANRFRTVRINFDGDSFTETDFLHFGVSTNQLDPPAFNPPESYGDGWGEFGVTAEVTFRNTNTNATSTASAVFVNVPAADTSEATLTGGAGGGLPAVIAQGTVPTQGFCSALFGVSFFNVTSRSIAYYDCGTGRAALVSVDNIIFP